VPADAERDPIEWAQHSALVAISVARTVLDLAEAAISDRERLERLATSGRSFAESWMNDAVRLASTMATGFGFEPGQPPAPSTPVPAPPAPAAPPSTAARAPRPQQAPRSRATKKATAAKGPARRAATPQTRRATQGQKASPAAGRPRSTTRRPAAKARKQGGARP
jgi:hypothetical protein